MSKYEKLWLYLKTQTSQKITLTCDEIEKIAGVPLDHSFLTYKKELLDFGWRVQKISMKNKTVAFEKIEEYNKPKIWTKNSKNSEFAVL